MTAKPRRKTLSAPKGRNKPAQGNALGDAPPEAQNPERAGQSKWPVVSLGELAANERNAITDGPFGSKLKTDHYTDTGPRVIRLKNIGDTEFVDAKAHISEAHFATLQKHRVFPGDVVIAALGEDPPRSCLVPDHLGPAIVKADCIRFKAGPRILPKFINYLLNAPELRRYAKAIVHGVGRPRLNLGEIKGLPIPVPPLDDQRRIVAEIEKQFTRLEAGVAALRRVQANLKRYRAAVLKAACEGRLCSAIEPASESEDGYGPPKALPEGWYWTTASEICEAVVDCHNKTAPYTESGIPLVRTTNIRGGRINLENTRFVDQPTYEFWSRRCTPKPGDVLFTREAPMGEAGIIPDGVTLCMGQRMMLLRASPKILNRYLLTALLTPGLLNHITKTAVGSGVQHLRVRDVESLPIPLPPLAEQTRIVAEVERRLSMVDELEAVVTTNFKRSIRLRQSVLQKAFTGNF